MTRYWLLIVVLSSSLLDNVWGLSCISGAFSVSRREAIRSTYCRNENVYSGRVVGVTCNCIPGGDSMLSAHCQQYQLNTSSSVLATRIVAAGVCSNSISSAIVMSCATLDSSVTSTGLQLESNRSLSGVDVRNLTASTGGCNLTCDFNTNSTDDYRHAYPCIYTVQVGEVFRGNYSSGDVVEELGPSVLIGGVANRVLQANIEYMVGVGGLCNPINEWSQTSSFSSDDLQVLRQSIACGQMSQSASLATSLVALLFSLLMFGSQ